MNTIAGGNLLKYKKYTVKDGKQTLVLTDSYAYGNTWKDQMTSYNGVQLPTMIWEIH